MLQYIKIARAKKTSLIICAYFLIFMRKCCIYKAIYTRNFVYLKALKSSFNIIVLIDLSQQKYLIKVHGYFYS